jgi:hypothetical protein
MHDLVIVCHVSPGLNAFAEDAYFSSRNDAFQRESRLRYAEAYIQKESTAEVFNSARAHRTFWVQGEFETIVPLPRVTISVKRLVRLW